MPDPQETRTYADKIKLVRVTLRVCMQCILMFALPVLFGAWGFLAALLYFLVSLFIPKIPSRCFVTILLMQIFLFGVFVRGVAFEGGQPQPWEAGGAVAFFMMLRRFDNAYKNDQDNSEEVQSEDASREPIAQPPDEKE